MRLFKLGEKKTNCLFLNDVTCEACLKFLPVQHRFVAILPIRKKARFIQLMELLVSGEGQDCQCRTSPISVILTTKLHHWHNNDCKLLFGCIKGNNKSGARK